MKNKQHRYSWPLAVLLTLLFLWLLSVPFLLLPAGGLWLLAAVLLLPLIPILEGLLLTPLYQRCGRFDYYSALLFATHNGQGLDLHVGTLCDYCNVLRWQQRGSVARRQVMQQLLQGLLALCDATAAGRLAPDTPLNATSYFFNSRSVARLGFIAVPAPRADRLNLWLAAAGLALRLSFIRGRWCWPDLRAVSSVQTSAANLLAHRRQIRQMLATLTRSAQ